MRSIVVVLCLVVFSLSACGSSQPIPQAPGLNARRYANLTGMASRDLSCPKEQLSWSSAGPYLHRMTGCGRVEEYYLYCPGLCVWAGSPGRQATFDLQCPREQLSLQELDRGKIGITGCDQRASYGVVCQGRSCQWYQDGTGAGIAAQSAAEEARRAAMLQQQAAAAAAARPAPPPPPPPPGR